MSNPFRVRFKIYVCTQGVALGWYILPLQGVKKHCLSYVLIKEFQKSLKPNKSQT